MTWDLTKTKPMAHQERVVGMSKDRDYFALFMEQGTGKTFCIIANAVHLFRQGKINAVVVYSDNGVHDNWAINEIPTHSPLSPDEQEIAVWHSDANTKERNRFIKKLRETPTDKLLWVLVNVESMRLSRYTMLIAPFMDKLRKVMMVVDESTSIKNHKAEVSKAACGLGSMALYRRILTGTPVSQGPLDLFGQCKFLHEDALPWKSFTAFKAMFAITQAIDLGPNRPAFVKIVGYQNQAVLARVLDNFSVRITKAECLDLPEKIYSTVYVEMTKEQKRIYSEMKNLMMAKLPPDGMLITENVMTMMLRLHQVALGYAYDSVNDTHIEIDSNRIPALKEIVSKIPLNEKAIIFCRFRSDVDQVVKMLQNMGLGETREYHGGVGGLDRTQAIHSFQNDKNVRWFVATEAAARGITLTAATYVVYYSQGFSLEKRLQSEDRAHRIGQKHNVNYIDIVARGTIDESVIRALKSKKEVADVIVDKKGLQLFIEPCFEDLLPAAP